MNWGLGHATRCIPIIKELEKRGFVPLIASDGAALLLLQKEFHHVKTFELPSYNIKYTKRPKWLKWKLLLDTPHILRTISAEKKVIKNIVQEEDIIGIISDNRFGARCTKVKNVFITHQLNVLSGNMTSISSRIHQNYIRKFDQCWVPDSPDSKNLSGMLGHLKRANFNLKYIGAISRFEKKEIPEKHDYLVLLSGPEPQRTLLQNILFKSFRGTTKRILFVRGVLNEDEFTCLNPNVIIKNYLYGKELEDAINSSRVIISRSGYTTLMDLAKLEKNAFFIPTPGQFEQDYLAERLMKLGIAPYCKQEDFEVSLLESLDEYTGMKELNFTADFGKLFAFFESE